MSQIALKKIWILSDKKSWGNSYLNVESTRFNSVEIVLFKKKIRKSFVLTKKMQLLQILEKLSTWSQKILTQCPKLKKKVMIFFGKKLWGKSYLNVEFNRLDTVEKFLRRDKSFFGQCPKVFKKLKAVKKAIFMKVLLWIRRMQFSQYRR